MFDARKYIPTNYDLPKVRVFVCTCERVIVCTCVRLYVCLCVIVYVYSCVRVKRFMSMIL